MHNCEPGWDKQVEARIFESGMYGAAIETCIEDDGGRLWCSNSEYATRVDFCPFCGYKAPNQVRWEK